MLLIRRFWPSQHSDYLMAGIYNPHNNQHRPRIYHLYVQEGPDIQQDNIERSENVPVLPKEPIVPISNGVPVPAPCTDLGLSLAGADVRALSNRARGTVS